MVLSKGKKILLIVIAAVVILTAAFFGWSSYRETKSTAERCVEGLMGESFIYDPYDEEDFSFFQTNFEKVRNKGALRKELVSVIEEYAQVSIYNTYGDGDGEEMETRYFNTPRVSSALDAFTDAVGMLNQLNYQEEAVRDGFADFFAQYAQAVRTDVETEEELKKAEELEDLLEDVSSFNEEAGDFYRVDGNPLCTEDELAEHYAQAVQMALDGEGLPALMDALESATASQIVGDRTWIDSGELVALLAGDSPEVLTLVNGIGGYYDGMDPAERSNYYGDFYYRTWTSGGNRYDTSGLSGVWSALTPGQRAEIQSGNRTTTHKEMSCQGVELEDEIDLREMTAAGYEYVYRCDDGAFLYVAPDAICYVGENGGTIQGDFSEILEEMEQQYAQAHSLAGMAGEASALDAYRGTFGLNGVPLFTSDFVQNGEQVYWTCTQVDPDHSFFWVKFGEERVDFFTQSLPVVGGEVTEEIGHGCVATVQFQNGVISYSLKNGTEELTAQEFVLVS